MKQLLSVILTLCLIMSAIPLAFAAPAADAPVMDGKTLITFGDSITALSTWPRSVAKATNMYLINAGIGGETVVDLARRWETDVMDHHPDYVTCMIGINDIGREFDEPHLPHRLTGYEKFLRTYEEIISRTVPEVKTMFVLSCCYMEPRKDEPLRAAVEKYNAGVKTLCEQYGAVYIDMMAVFDKAMEHNHPVRYTWDRVHPSFGGHMMIAREFLKTAGAELG